MWCRFSRPEDIRDVNHNSNQSVFIIERGAGLSQFQGAFPMRTDWPIEQSEFVRRRDHMPWPQAGKETITISPSWPSGNDSTITSVKSPGSVEDVLKGIRQETERN